MSHRISRWRILWIFLAANWAFTPGVVRAQSGYSDAGEMTAFAGGSFGFGTQPMVGGSLAAAISRNATALLESSFQPMGKYTIQPWPASSTVQRSYLYDFNFCFHIRFPVKDRWEPYAIAGVGLLWNKVRQNAAGPSGNAVYNDYDQFNAGLHTGGGLRYFIGEKWGIRPEVKVIVSKQTYARLSIGIFYVLPANWP